MNNHSELSKLSSYLDGELDGAERAALEAHLPSCAECSTTLAALQATLTDLKVLADAEVPELDVRRLRAEVASRRRRESNRGRFVMATGAVAASVIAFAAIALTHSGSNHSAGTLAAPDLGSDTVATVLTSSLNYDATSVRDVFDLYGTSARAPEAAARAQHQEASPATDALSAGGKTSAAGLQACEARVLENAKESVRPLLYLTARYNGEDAYFLLYDVPSSAPTRRELWVVRPGSCAVVRFEQKKL